MLVLVLLPLLGAAVSGALVKSARDHLASVVGFVVALVELVLVAVVFSLFDPAAPTRFQGELKVSWIPAFGVSFSLGLDGILQVLLDLIEQPLSSPSGPAQRCGHLVQKSFVWSRHVCSSTAVTLLLKRSQSRRCPASAFLPRPVSSYTRRRLPSTLLQRLRSRPSASRRWRAG